MKLEIRGENVSHHQPIISLLKWMKTKGYKSNKMISPAIFPDCGRGMMAKCNIEKNSCIISIPYSLLITTAVANRSWLGVIIRKNSFELTSREILCLFLVYEKFRGTDSPWHPYLNTLPTNYSLPINWKQIPSDLPERIKNIFSNQIDIVKLSFSRVQNFIDFLETNKLSLKGVIDFEKFVWAWCTVQTRGVYFKEKNSSDESDGYALAPFLDLFNHSATVEVSAKFCEDKNCYEIITHESYTKSNQIFINYGTHDNLHLILNYGFYIVRNVHSTVQFSLGEISDALKEMKLDVNLIEKTQLLEENKLVRDVSCRLGEVSWNFIVCARILVCNYEELQQWSRAFNGSISSRNEKCKDDLIDKCINKRLNENLKCVLPTKYSNHNFSLVLIEEERNILTSCISK